MGDTLVPVITTVAAASYGMCIRFLVSEFSLEENREKKSDQSDQAR